MILPQTVARAEAFRAMNLDGMPIEQIAAQEGYSKDYIRRLISAVTPPPTSYDPFYPKRAVAAAIEAAGVDREQFFSGVKKPKKLVYARWAVMAGMRKRGSSLHQVANRLHRDHTTVVYAVRQIEYLAARNPEVAELVALVDAA